MGTILASVLIGRVSAALLNDSNKVRFTEPHLLAFLNEGQRVIAAIDTSAYTALQNIVLAAGTKQAVPATARALVRPLRNMGANGTTIGNAITMVTDRVLDVLLPNWHTGAQSADIKHVIYDVRRKETFWTYPPAIAGTQIEVELSLFPTDIAANQAILLDDSFEAPLMNYMLARSYEKDAEYAGAPALVAQYYERMATQLGLSAAALRAIVAEINIAKPA